MSENIIPFLAILLALERQSFITTRLFFPFNDVITEFDCTSNKIHNRLWKILLRSSSPTVTCLKCIDNVFVIIIIIIIIIVIII